MYRTQAGMEDRSLVDPQETFVVVVAPVLLL